MPRATSVLLDQRLPISSGQERHLGPYRLLPDSFLNVRVSGDVKTYAGVFTADEYATQRGRGSGAFPFKFGSDRPSWSLSANATRDEDYWVVLRVGVFSPNGVVACRIEQVGPDVPAPTAPAANLPPSVNWALRIVGSFWAVVRSRVFQAAAAVVVAVADYYVLKEDGPSNFFAALGAEGTLSLALVTAYLGVARGRA